MAEKKLSKLEKLVRIGATLGFALLAIGFVWTSSAEHTAQRVHASEHAHQYASGTADRVKRACGGVEAGAVLECVAKEVAASHEDQRSEYDLSAQNQMANWAFWMMAVSAVTMALTAWALWYIKGTLDETRAMTREAERATKAAQDTVTETRRIGEAQVRCYLSISDVWMSLHTKNVPLITIAMQNSGQSPALNVRITITLFWINLKTPGGIKRLIHGGGEDIVTTIPAGPSPQKLTLDVKDGFDAEEMAKLDTEIVLLELAANIQFRWTDVFGVEGSDSRGYVGALRQPEEERLFKFTTADEMGARVRAEQTRRRTRRE